VPHPRTHDVEGEVAVATEAIGPRVLELKSDVVGAELAGDGSREEHHVGERAEVGDEAVAASRR